jgi:hypothetical protein
MTDFSSIMVTSLPLIKPLIASNRVRKINKQNVLMESALKKFEYNRYFDMTVQRGNHKFVPVRDTAVCLKLTCPVTDLPNKPCE